jgi:phosphonate transport system substrate-binding protein
MQSRISLVFVVFLAFALSACGGATATPTSAPAAAATTVATTAVPTTAATQAATTAATSIATEATTAATPAATEVASAATAAASESAAGGSSGETVIWAFVPSEKTQALEDSQKLADLVSEKAGIKIKTVIATDFIGVVEAMCGGQAQMGALNTYGYLVASSRKCADVGLVSVRNGQTTYNGQFITKADSGIKTLADLKGKTFCRPDPISTSGWVVPSITMKANKIDPEKDLKQVVDAGAHDAVVEQVYTGNCDAGATFNDARTLVVKNHPDVNEKVTVFAYTSNIPNDTVSFATSFDAAKRAAITKALVDVAGDKANADLLKKVYNWNGLAEAKDAFFDDFRQQLDAAGMSPEVLAPPKKPAATAAATTAATPAATP